MPAHHRLNAPCLRFIQMSNHTINSWKKYCLYHKDTIEDLRKRATSNAEKKAISQAVAEATRAEAIEETLPIPQQVDLPQTNSQQVDLQQTDPQQPAPQQTVPQLIAPPQSTSQPTVPQLNIPQKTLPEPTVLPPTIPQQATPQQSVPRQATTLHETLPPQPSYEKAAEPGVVLVKTEPLDEDQLDFVFVTEVLSGWKPHEETDAALWKRMETMVCFQYFLLIFGQLMHVHSGPVLLRHHGKHFVRSTGPGSNISSKLNPPKLEGSGTLQTPSRSLRPTPTSNVALLHSCFQSTFRYCGFILVFIY